MDGKGTKPKPDFGIYLCEAWRDRLSDVWTNGVRADVPRAYPAIVVSWPDYGTIGDELYERIVHIAYSKIRHGKRLDIGCHGGHGRTGVLLAGLIVAIERLPGNMAISEAKRRYCKKAIETMAQGDMVRDYAKSKGY
jgi:protein-tyrosine phosphatase